MTNRLNPPVDIGFIGLGHMGAPMAARLAAAGFEGVSVLDGGFSCTVAGRRPTEADPESGGP